MQEPPRGGRGVVFYSELAREKMWSRIHLIPLLQAEEDRDQVRRHWADKQREKELLGTETKVYHSDRYVCLGLLYCVELYHMAVLPVMF